MLNTPEKNVRYTNLSFYILFLKGQIAALCFVPITWQLVYLTLPKL